MNTNFDPDSSVEAASAQTPDANDHALLAGAEQMVQAFVKSNQSVETLLEELLVVMEAQQQIIDSLDRRADLLARQINSLKNP